MAAEDIKTLITVAAFGLTLCAYIITLSKFWAKLSFGIDGLSKTTEDLDDKIERLEKSFGERFENLDEKLFPKGRPAFIYREDCKACHADICAVIRKSIGELKGELLQRDSDRSAAHARLHQRLDEQSKEILEMKARLNV